MILDIPWESYTYASYLKSQEERLKILNKELEEARVELGRARKQYEAMRGIGMEHASLPKNYGEILLAQKVIAGEIPENEVAENIMELVKMMKRE